MSSPPRSVADVLDPGLAQGPLAAALRRGRDAWDVELVDEDVVVVPSARPYVLSLLAERASPLLVLTARTSDAESVADGLSAYLGEDRVAVFPAWETLPHERLSPQPRTVGRRLAVLDRLTHPDEHDAPLLAIVAPVRAALQPMSRSLATQRPIVLDADTTGFDALLDGLAALGYSRVPQVETRGEFAVRGGIVDVFPTASDHAVRVEFWGDDIDSLRAFGVADQRSTGPVVRVVIDPAREVVLDEPLRERARDAIARWPELTDELDRLAAGQTFEGCESLVTLLTDDPALLVDFLPERAGVALLDPMLLEDRAAQLREEAEVLADTAWRNAASVGLAPGGGHHGGREKPAPGTGAHARLTTGGGGGGPPRQGGGARPPRGRGPRGGGGGGRPRR
ncbi:MAG: hypothetical protein JJT89_18495, partial [Nitriliruptoraceae bacterium]|nr:hypothetical protein [Nitriliruptoraceae bacterium]